MASPIGHSLMGVSVYLLLFPRKKAGSSLEKSKTLLAVFLMANMPDIDFLFGFIRGKPNQYHGYVTHSLVFAMIMAVLYAYIMQEKKFLFNNALLAFSIIVSHDLMDSFSSQKLGFYPGDGAALFYPFSDKKIASPLALFYGVRHQDLDQLLSSTNIWHIVYEILVLGPLLAFVLVTRRGVWVRKDLKQ
jgi:membrane-bound metal-dependent hydrolase YbcI (DUF457 family)